MNFTTILYATSLGWLFSTRASHWNNLVISRTTDRSESDLVPLLGKWIYYPTSCSNLSLGATCGTFFIFPIQLISEFSQFPLKVYLRFSYLCVCIHFQHLNPNSPNQLPTDLSTSSPPSSHPSNPSFKSQLQSLAQSPPMARVAFGIQTKPS